MAEPWDVYVSFMKMNGVPLLPPLLDKEQRSEMQYYQMLAKEVENRISSLKPFGLPTVPDSDKEEDTSSDSASESPMKTHQENAQSVQDFAFHIESALKNLVDKNNHNFGKPDSPGKISFHSKSTEQKQISKVVYNFSTLAEDKEIDLPEKDLSSSVDCKGAKGKKISFSASSKETSEIKTYKNKPDKSVTITKKRISGSLVDLSHKSPEKTPQIVQLKRQNSYTLLTPSPQLLAHLESQQQQTGMDTVELSMSDSQFSPKQKRRSWDLESAKANWSNMAMELKQNGVPKSPKSPKISKTEPSRHRVNSITSRTVTCTEVKTERAGDKLSTPRPLTPSSPPPPASHKYTTSPSDHDGKTIPPQCNTGDKEEPSKKMLELLETIQKQQHMQMASLIEKQNREKMMLQQVFEEQNLYLSRQIKNICPELAVRPVSVDAPTRDPGAVCDPYFGLGGPERYRYDGLLSQEPPEGLRDVKSPPFTRSSITQTRGTQKPPPKSPKGKRRVGKQGPCDATECPTEPAGSPVADMVRGARVRPAPVPTPCDSGSGPFARATSKAERAAATRIVAHARGYLTRRLMGTARVRGYVQTIRDALLCALQLHQDRGGIRGADVDLHRRLIQQITAACYAVHDTVISSTISEKMALIAADRARLKQQAAKQLSAPAQRRASPSASPLQLRGPGAAPGRFSPTRPGSQRAPAARQSPYAAMARRPSSSPQRRPSPPSPPPRSALMQRRSSFTAPTKQQKRTDIMSQSLGRYALSSPTMAAMAQPTQDATLSGKHARGQSLLKQRWL